jgi:hypothetical protein
MDAPTGTQEVPERQRKRKLPQVSLQDNFNPVDLIKSQETLASSTKSLAEDISRSYKICRRQIVNQC